MTGETQFNTLLKLAWNFWWTNSVFSCRIDFILLISSLFSFLLLLRRARWDTYSVKMSPLCSFAARTQVETSIGWLAWALGSCVCSKPLSTSACASFVSLSSPPFKFTILTKQCYACFLLFLLNKIVGRKSWWFHIKTIHSKDLHYVSSSAGSHCPFNIIRIPVQSPINIFVLFQTARHQMGQLSAIP